MCRTLSWGFWAATLAALCSITGCSGHNRAFHGKVEFERHNESLQLKYDIEVNRSGVDSVAIQLGGGDWRHEMRYGSEVRVKDSLYRSLGDSLSCCCDSHLDWLLHHRPDTLADDSVVLPPGSPLCWWLRQEDRDTVRYWISPVSSLPWWMASRSYIDSILNTVPMDSLRRISVPCTWGKNATIVASAWSTDSVIYRVTGFADEKPIRIKGEVTYALAGNSRPDFYALKLYGQNSDNEISLPYPENRLWAGVIPPRPMTRRFRFEEKGGFLGMAGGLGVTKFANDGFTASYSGVDYMADGMLGLLYYSPSAIYQASCEFNGFDSSGGVPSLSTASPLGVRYFPFSRSSQGFSFQGASEFTSFESRIGGRKIEDNEFGAEVGVGYDTDFDRLTYSYHTTQGGYHEVELLIGITALQQGKAGLKVSVLAGDKIKFATIQVYMENRLDFQTMTFRNPRSLLSQALAFGGLIGLWSLIY